MGRITGRRFITCCVLALFALLVFVNVAQAYDERTPPPSGHFGLNDADCKTCHPAGADACGPCHFGDTTPAGKGPHGLYTSITKRCELCHEVHDAGGGKLLPAPTVAGACATCHDATGGEGVYGTIAARGLTVGAKHRIDTTNVVPGGDATTGGSSTMAFVGQGGRLGCDDCHSPHDANTVAPFEHERRRTIHDFQTGWIQTNRLLRKRPAGVATTVTAYGSDWCAACHKGRVSGGAVHNHPAESRATTTNPFIYNNVAILNSDNLTTVTVLGKMASTNRGYLMPFPRTAQQGAHLPICQQCHEDSRNVGSLDATGNAGDAQPFQVRSDATTVSVAADNPRFQNFPHETVNARMTVESADDLCTNCHPPAVLP